MPGAICIRKFGGPEVLAWEDVFVDEPQLGEVRIRHTAIGVNYVDVYHRTGYYPVSLPAIIGREAAGIVERVGEGVTEFVIGDRVAYGNAPIGAYSEVRVIPADRLVKIPDDITDIEAASSLLRGLTVQFLLCQTANVTKGDTVLFHAIAGGVGSIACQWLKHIGVTVIGTVGTSEKLRLASELGCDYVINYTEDDFVGRVREITTGKLVPIAYDSVGKVTFNKTLKCIRPKGLMVSFGQSSGPIEQFDIGILAANGSLFLTRPTLNTYAAQTCVYRRMASDYFGLVSAKAIRPRVTHAFHLKDVAEAHRMLESRQSTGQMVLLTS